MYIVDTSSGPLTRLRQSMACIPSCSLATCSVSEVQRLVLPSSIEQACIASSRRESLAPICSLVSTWFVDLAVAVPHRSRSNHQEDAVADM